MADPFKNHNPGLDSPASILAEITPNDTTDLDLSVRALNVAQSGAVRVETVGGSIATLYVAAGVAFPVRAKRVYATGTDAIGIVGLI